MVAPAFGFSVGDFVAAIELIGKAAKALRESEGAARQYSQAIVELELLENVLKRVQRLRPSIDNATTVQKIHLCAHACHVPLAEFLASIEKYDTPLQLQNGRAQISLPKQMVRGGRKIQWALVVEQELAKLKAKIGPMLAMINILLNTESLEDISRVQSAVQDDLDVGKKTLAQLHNLEGFLTKQVANRDQVACLSSSIEALTIQQAQAHQEGSLAFHSSAESLESRLDIQEDLIRTLLDQMSSASLFSISKPMTPTDASPYIVARPVVESNDAHSNKKVALKIQQVLEALHKGIAHALFLFICLAPAFVRLFRFLTALPRGPTLLLQDNIRLEDALGRVLSLPYEHFRFWPMLQTRLECAFRDQPGEVKVAKNQFHIINLMGGGHRVFTKKTWERSVFPGAQLAMSMLFQNWSIPAHACPRCDALSADEKDSSWTQCKLCGLTYRLLERQQQPPLKRRASYADLLEDVMAGVEFVSSNDTTMTAKRKAFQEKDDEERLKEIAYFRRIHILGVIRESDTHSNVATTGNEDSGIPLLHSRSAPRHTTSASTSVSPVQDFPPASNRDDVALVIDDKIYGWHEVKHARKQLERQVKRDKRVTGVVKWQEAQESETGARDLIVSSEEDELGGSGNENQEIKRALSVATSREGRTTFDSRFSYTDPARMFSETEPRWRESNNGPRRGSVDRNRPSRESSVSAPDPSTAYDSDHFSSAIEGAGAVDKDQREHPEVDPSFSSVKSLSNDQARPKPKGILKKPTERFPEDPHPIREGVAPLKPPTNENIPPGARWTKIDRRLVNPEALEEANERFEERLDCVVVLRVLMKAEIQKLAERTREIRDEREDKEQIDQQKGRHHKRQRVARSENEYGADSEGSEEEGDTSDSEGE